MQFYIVINKINEFINIFNLIEKNKQTDQK